MGETLPFFAGRIQRAFEHNPVDAHPAKRLQDYLADNVPVTTSGTFDSQVRVFDGRMKHPDGQWI